MFKMQGCVVCHNIRSPSNSSVWCKDLPCSKAMENETLNYPRPAPGRLPQKIQGFGSLSQRLPRFLERDYCFWLMSLGTDRLEIGMATSGPARAVDIGKGVLSRSAMDRYVSSVGQCCRGVKTGRAAQSYPSTHCLHCLQMNVTCPFKLWIRGVNA